MRPLIQAIHRIPEYLCDCLLPTRFLLLPLLCHCRFRLCCVISVVTSSWVSQTLNNVTKMRSGYRVSQLLSLRRRFVWWGLRAVEECDWLRKYPIISFDNTSCVPLWNSKNSDTALWWCMWVRCALVCAYFLTQHAKWMHKSRVSEREEQQLSQKEQQLTQRTSRQITQGVIMETTPSKERPWFALLFDGTYQ